MPRPILISSTPIAPAEVLRPAPSQGNRSMEVLDPELRAQVGALALALIEGGR